MGRLGLEPRTLGLKGLYASEWGVRAALGFLTFGGMAATKASTRPTHWASSSSPSCMSRGTSTYSRIGRPSGMISSNHGHDRVLEEQRGSA